MNGKTSVDLPAMGAGPVARRAARPAVLRPAAGGAAARQPKMVMRHGKLVRADAPRIRDEQPNAVPDSAGNHDAVLVAQPLGGLAKASIVMMVLAILIPNVVYLGSVKLTAYTLLLVLAFPWAFVTWLSGTRVKRLLPDYLMLAFTVWAALALTVNAGMLPIETVGLHFVQTFGAYLIGRLLIRDMRSMQLFVITAAIASILLLPFVVYEAATGTQVLLRFAKMAGQAHGDLDLGTRNGVYRSQGIFEHPILMGVFSAGLLSLFVYGMDGRSRMLRWLSIVAAPVSAVCSMSTAALLSLNVQFGLMLWGRLFRTVKKHWTILTCLLITLYVIVDLLSTKTPFHVFVNYATFSAQSSYNRILIWQFGTAEVARHPIFGIGMGEWERPRYMSNSMDNFWLVQAVRYGLPGLMLLLGSFFVILKRISRLHGPTVEIDHLRRGVIFSVLATMITIFSVHLWNASYVWLMLVLGAITWLTMPVGAASADDHAPLKT